MYHRFVNTTPKPNATKNKSGLLVGLSLSFVASADVDASGGAEDVEVGIIEVVRVDMVDMAGTAELEDAIVSNREMIKTDARAVSRGEGDEWPRAKEGCWLVGNISRALERFARHRHGPREPRSSERKERT